MDRLDALVKRLGLIQQVADHGHWLTLDELSQLLGVSPAVLTAAAHQGHGFHWRNVRCLPVPTASGMPEYWQILPLTAGVPNTADVTGTEGKPRCQGG